MRIDLHRLRSLIVPEDEGGNELGVVRIDNDPVALAAALADAGPGASGGHRSDLRLGAPRGAM